jgi:adenylosuccinate synthase
LSKKAIVAVGLQFGDEGKGATVDYLCRQFPVGLVVRYCGGHQCGHNVVTPDGRSHTFAQFGSGTLAGVPTYVGPDVIIEPLALQREAAHLAEIDVADPRGLLTVHPRALVATPYHALLNQLRERVRGSHPRGSCGVGVGETRRYWLTYGDDAVYAADLAHRPRLDKKLHLLRRRCREELASWPGDVVSAAWYAAEPDPRELTALLAYSAPRVAELPAAPEGLIVFEGAQGVLLDETYGFPPYDTWSTVTPQHALELCAVWGLEQVYVLGVVKAFTTRHGPGPLPTFDPALDAALRDPGNPYNAWQGDLRVGHLDLPLLRYALDCVDSTSMDHRVQGLAVSWLDRARGGAFRVADAYSNDDFRFTGATTRARQGALTDRLFHAVPHYSDMGFAALADALGRPISLTAHGRTANDRQLCNEAGAALQEFVGAATTH